jgi:beta-glucosidase
LLVLLICSVFVGFISSQTVQQIIKARYESDITTIPKKSKLSDNYIPVILSPNSILTADYSNPQKSASVRANDLIKRLTFEEKLAFTGGFEGFLIPGVQRLGIRPAIMADASQGVRLGTISVEGKSTSFPGMLPLASTWNDELAQEFGKCIGEECRALGVDILLGPGINMQRLSVGGRNFEYMGEDPYLTSRIATAYVEGLQSQKVVACPKHLIANDQEFCRHIANGIVSERALREIYLPPWESVIKNAHCMAIMTGNNALNGVPCAINKSLIADILRKEYGFNGIAMTDWQNTNYYPEKQNLVLSSGESLLMPVNKTFVNWVNNEIKNSPELKKEVDNQLNKMIYPNIYTLFKMGIYDRFPQDKKYLDLYPNHQKLAEQCAEESIVLLKNENNILPVSKDRKIVLIGNPEIYSGSGSGFVLGYDQVSFTQGLKKVYGENFSYFEKIDSSAVVNADVVFFNFNKFSGEGFDVPFDDAKEIESQLNRLICLNKNIVVLMNACNTVPMPWLPKVKAILWCYFLGQERGNALAKIVSGVVSPSGKLPFTIEKDFADSPSPQFNFIGGKPFWKANNEYKRYWLGQDSVFEKGFTDYIKPHEMVNINYDEGVFIGYRWYESKNIPVYYPFGFGLSYSQFEYKDFSCKNKWKNNGSVDVTINVVNTGKMEAKEVVQLYVSSKQSSVPRPKKELKAYKKVSLAIGESKKITFKLEKEAFHFWSEKTHSWQVDPGKYDIIIESSDKNRVLKQTIELY